MKYRIPGFALTLLVAATALTAAPASGQQNPYLQPNESWITLDGTVEDVTRDAFTLLYGDGMIRVEMDDGDRDADAYPLVEGDRVTVTGKIDDDFLEVARIEASSVYVHHLGVRFYASAADEEDWRMMPEPPTTARTILRGTVTDVRSDEFDINTGARKVTVDIDELGYDPLDDAGYQKIEVGDYVSVTGGIDFDLFEGRQLEAASVVTIFSNDSPS
jgi:uncharacterized protein YdeI (BOF family)